jgi:hypothetical protein
MRINTKNKNPIQIDENVENFTYLRNVSIDGGATKDVNVRIQKAQVFLLE